MQTQVTLDAGVLRGVSLSGNDPLSICAEFGERSFDDTCVNSIKVIDEYTCKVMAHIRVQHSKRAIGTGLTWHVYPATIERTCDSCPVHGTGALRCDQGADTGVVSPLDTDSLDRVEQGLLRYAHDPDRGLLNGNLQRLGDMVSNRSFGKLRVQIHGAAGIEARCEAAQ